MLRGSGSLRRPSKTTIWICLGPVLQPLIVVPMPPRRPYAAGDLAGELTSSLRSSRPCFSSTHTKADNPKMKELISEDDSGFPEASEAT